MWWSTLTRGDGMSDLLIHRHGRVLQLTLNRPQARNALNNALLTQIAEALGRRQLMTASASALFAVTRVFSPPGLTSMKWRKRSSCHRMIFAHGYGGELMPTKPLIASVNGYASAPAASWPCCAT